MSVPKGFPPLDQLNTPGGQKRLNGWLQGKAFCTGFQPTALDKTIFETIGIFTDKSCPHIFRWSKHVSSYSADVRASWGGEAPAAPAPAAAKKEKKEKKPKRTDDDDVDDLFGDDDVTKDDDDDDDDVDDLFGDDDEEEDISDIIAKRIAADKDLQAAIKAKKEKAAKKGAQVQKTMFVYDVKPYDTETDLLALAQELKQQTHPGIICWGEEHKLIDVAFGVKKLRISMIVDDDKACTDDLEELMIADGRDDSIQSIDLVTMSKV
eukprot:Stramenopile-MAST_4_protein_1346